MNWLDSVAAALDARVDDPCRIFFRDDDAGWGDDRLVAMLDAFERAGVSLDLAVIPDEVSTELAPLLRARAARGAVGLHQHGRCHVNHEQTGRKCEFGASRSPSHQRADIVAGRVRLLEMFGDLVQPIFTPPWNRCTAATAHAAASAGLTVLSRDNTAAPLGEHVLTEVPVTFDWFGKRKGVRWGQEEMGVRLATQILAGAPVGVMLHHAVTDDDELAVIADLVHLVAGHRGSRPTSIAALANERAVTAQR